jgi:PAS domain S-box-containing protein/putative nucleotidyltransferase with HDIG domain
VAGKRTHRPLSKKITKLEREPHQYNLTDWALRRENERFQILVERVPFGIAIIDRRGRYRYINPKFTEIFGYTLEDIPTGREWFNKAYPDEQSRKEALSAWIEDYKRDETGGGRPRVFDVTCKDGSQTKIRFRAVHIDMGEQFVIYEELSQHKRTEKALHEREEKYRTILQGITEGYFEVDLAGNLTFFNDSLCKMLGYRRDELKGMNNRHYMDTDNAKRVYETFNYVYRTGNPYRAFDWELTRKDGSRCFVETSVSLIRDSEGQAIGFRGIARDVTPRKQTEDALRESEERYRQLVTHAPAGIYEVDFINQRFVTVNDVMCEYTGYSKEEFLALSPSDILTEDSKKLFIERMSRAFAGEEVPETVEYKIKGKGGKEFWVILNAKYTYVKGVPTGAAVVVYDITQRKLAEFALRESEEKYRLLVDNANDGIFIAQDGRIKFPNPKTQEILGYSTDELAEMPYTDLIHPDDRVLLPKIREGRLKEGARSSTYAVRVMDRDGKQLWAQISSVPIIWEERPATLNFVRDISLQKKAEQGLRQSLAKLRKITGATIQAMAQTVEVRDPYTAGHQRRVSDLARAIATQMGLASKQIDGIRMAGVIHDIGKISVPAEILSKPGLLTDLEFSLIKTHPQVGYDILKEIEFPWDIAQIVLQHHERLDGSGYPQGLSGGVILLEARILAVADVVEAMASHRPYRPALGIEKALQEISDRMGRVYDADVVGTCLELFNQKMFQFRWG